MQRKEAGVERLQVRGSERKGREGERGKGTFFSHFKPWLVGNAEAAL